MCLGGAGIGNANTSSSGGGGSKQTLSLSSSDVGRPFKRVMQTTSSNSTTLTGGTTMVSIKQEGTVQDGLVPSYVDSTTFLNSPTVQQPATASTRQQSSTSAQQHRTGSGAGSSDDCEPVSLPSKFWLVFCRGRAISFTSSVPLASRCPPAIAFMLALFLHHGARKTFTYST